MAEDKASKTEQPTPRRLQQAREKGQVSKSTEVNTVVVLLASVFTLYFASSWMFGQLSRLMTDTLSNIGQIPIDGGNLMAFLIGNLEVLAMVAAPLLIVIPIMGVLANLLQIGGPAFSTHPLIPNLSKINPISGFSKFFSSKSLVELVKSVLKISMIAAAAYYTVKGEMETILALGSLTPAQIGYFTASLSFEIFVKTCWLLVVLAIMDLAFQKWNFVRDMRMTKDEIKEEMKQTEGDPLVKSRIRSVQREMARKRMMSKVPEADVVVTNPTHLAVALLYDNKKYKAPIVVAKGQALIAEKIKRIARENGIPVMEDKPLARSLFKSVEIGQEIPVLFYQAVAEILSYVYRMKGKKVHG